MSETCETCGRKLPTEKAKEERRKRKTIGIHVPDDNENGAELWDDLVSRVKGRLIEAGLYDEGNKIPTYEALFAALTDWLNDAS